MKKFLQASLLAVLMLLPWATKVNAQVSCPSGQTSCGITIRMADDFGDGWDYGDYSIQVV